MLDFLDATIALILKVNPTNQSGDAKKSYVMSYLQHKMNPEEWALYRDMISSLIDFLVAVGKKERDFTLVKKTLFSCCR